MTTFWTILVLTYTTAVGEAESYILFPSEKACWEASDVIYEEVYKNYRDSMAKCKKTDRLSGTIRPALRPWKDGEK